MFKWFRKCKTAEEGKQLYRDLCKQYHPDNGASGDELKEINAEFKTWWQTHKDIHTAQNGTTYTSEKKTTETAEEFMDIINKLSRVPSIEVELCGSWLWITGNTYAYKDYLKDCGCRWSVGKKKWYWTTEPYRNKTSKMSMDAIRLAYGSELVQMNRQAAIE